MQHLADEYFVRAQDHVLHHRQSAVDKRFARAEADLERRVASLSDDQVLGLNDPAWAQQVMAEIEVAPPVLDVGAAEGIDGGAVTVDCAGTPGIAYSMVEWGGPVRRDGNRLRLVIPGANLDLLASRLPSGGTGRRVDIHDDRIERTYEWPQVRGAEELEADIDAVLRELEHGCEQIATQVRERNEKLASRVLTLIEERRQKILAAQSFVGGLRLPIRPRAEASTRIPDLPRPKARPRAMSQPSEAKTAPALNGPKLDDFYRHFLTVVGNALVGLERSPGRFANADEEWLRDQLLVTLNTHYDGLAHGESFNGAGKTDILIRHANNNVVIAECKWWDGKKVLISAFEQLLRYTTWRDNRLALIMFVGTKGIDAVIETTKAEIADRPEFMRWSPTDEESQLACQLNWDDGSRVAALTIFFAHLPKPGAPLVPPEASD